MMMCTLQILWRGTRNDPNRFQDNGREGPPYLESSSGDDDEDQMDGDAFLVQRILSENPANCLMIYKSPSNVLFARCTRCQSRNSGRKLGGPEIRSWDEY